MDISGELSTEQTILNVKKFKNSFILLDTQTTNPARKVKNSDNVAATTQCSRYSPFVVLAVVFIKTYYA